MYAHMYTYRYVHMCTYTYSHVLYYHILVTDTPHIWQWLHEIICSTDLIAIIVSVSTLHVFLSLSNVWLYMWRFSVEIGSHNYRSWEVPWYAICKLENQESVWCNALWSLKTRELRAQCVRGGNDGCSQLKNGQFVLSVSFYSTWALNGLEDACPLW
jgi:hypothetical protein